MISTNLGREARRPILAFLPILLALALAAPASAQITIDEGASTVSTSKLEMDFGDTGGTVEWLKDLKWRNSVEALGADLTAESGVAGGACGGAPGEFWGQSYGNEDFKGPAPVATGAHGTWAARGSRSIELNSVLSTLCSGDTPGIPVRTRYTFFDSGQAANMVRVDRRWSFVFNQVSTNPAQGMRTYVPRLNYGTYNQEIYPKGDETGLATDGVGEVLRTGAAWNDKWYAINAAAPAAPPILNSGVLFLRDPASVVANPASLRIDYDSSSGANNSGVSIDRPLPSGWLAPLSETFYLCFYDATSWPVAERSVTRLPDGCEPRTPPLNVTPPTLSPGAGNPRAGDGYTATPGTWEFSDGSYAYQWSRCAEDVSEDFVCTPIGGATGTGYTASAADVGKSLRVSVTTKSTSGESETAESNVAGFISGTVYEGEKGVGKEAAGAPVQVCKRSGSPCRSTFTDGAGSYRLQVPVSGKYRVTAFPPSGSSAASRTRKTISRVRPEVEKTGQDVVLALPQAPPPGVEFTGSGVRAKPSAGGVPVVHWQEPFVIEVEKDKDDRVELKLELGEGKIIRIPPLLPPEPAEDPEKAIFKFPVPPLFPSHGAANVTIVARGAGTPAEEQEAEEETEEEETEEEEDEEDEEEEDEEEEDEEEGPEEEESPEEEEDEEDREDEEEEDEENEEEEDDEDTFPIYIDPSGFVRTTDGAPLADATVTLYRSDSREGPFSVVPDGSAVMSPMNRVNPDRSEASGHFGWDVIAGFYKVRAEKSGCNAPGDSGSPFVETPAQDIPPPVTDLDIRLECPAARPVVRLRPNLKLPRKGGKVKVKKSGAYALKGATVSCPAESTGPCAVTLTALKKKKKLGATSLTVKAGRSAKLAGKLSKKGLKQLKPKGTKATLSVLAAVPGGDSATGSVAATLVPAKKKKPRRK